MSTKPPGGNDEISDLSKESPNWTTEIIILIVVAASAFVALLVWPW